LVADLPATRAAYQQLIDDLYTAGVNTGKDVDPWLAAWGRKDLFFLLRYLLGRKDCDNDWYFERCREVQAAPDNHLDLWSREHGKSSVITFALTIFDILNDPEVTFGIFSHTRPIAKAFLRQIKQEFENNVDLKRIYSDVLFADPRNESPKWSEDEGIVVKRKGNPKEATIEAWGVVDGQPTSKHYKKLVYDDLVTRESVTSPEMINKTMEALALSYNLGVIDGPRRFIGTRYHTNDPYRTIIDRKTAIPRIYPATKDGKVDGEPVLLTREQLAKKRADMGPYVFGAQMLQNPTADEAQGFKPEWIQHATINRKGLNVVLLFDPASAKKKTSDYTAGWALGLGADRNVYVLDIVRDRLNLSERTALYMAWHRKWQPMAVGIERYGMMADIEALTTLQEDENYRFPVTELGGAMPKNDRIRRLIPWFERGRIHLPPKLDKTNYEGRTVDLVKTFVDEEYTPFPVGSHDDMLDALARFLEPDLPIRWPAAYVADNEDEDTGDQGRSAVTGY
jgi:phage terminase large subunit-like protein